MLRLVFALLLATWLGCAAMSQPSEPWFPVAPPLPAPEGDVIRVSTVDELFQASADVKPGGTILIADGHYMMPRYFEISTDDVTMRSESGDRDAVILDGAESRHGELVGVRACSGVTFADFTIQNIAWNGFKLNSNTGISDITIYNCVIHNIWQRGIKGVAVPVEMRENQLPRNCRVQYCLFYNDRPKEFSDDPAEQENPERFNGDYIGGMDIMFATEWVISDNVFIGINGRAGSARGAIFLWHETRDCIVERNIIIDCDSGICLGNSHRGFETEVHAINCIVRNNFVVRCHENGILADYTQDCSILHNSVHDPDSRLRRLIRIVHDNDGLTVRNNLLSGPEMRQEQIVGEIDVSDNLTRDITDAFADAAAGNLHLKAALPETFPHLDSVPDDIDGDARPDQTSPGADQL